MTGLRPEVADMDPRLVPLSEQAFDLAGVDVVFNTHLHFDHCGGNHLFAGRPIYVQRQELEDAARRTTTPFASGSRRPACATSRSTASSSCCPASASSRHRATRAACRWWWSRRAGVRSSSAVTWPFASARLDEPRTEGQLRVSALEPELVWLAHEHEPWRPRTMQAVLS